VLHPKDCDLCAAPLITAIPEWPDIELGVPAMEAVLPNQAADGSFLAHPEYLLTVARKAG
jgi:hypothetical protein